MVEVMKIMVTSFKRSHAALSAPNPAAGLFQRLLDTHGHVWVSLFWVALHGMAHSFIEVDKAVVHVIILVGFLWLWFSVCLPSDG